MQATPASQPASQPNRERLASQLSEAKNSTGGTQTNRFLQQWVALQCEQRRLYKQGNSWLIKKHQSDDRTAISIAILQVWPTGRVNEIGSTERKKKKKNNNDDDDNKEE